MTLWILLPIFVLLIIAMSSEIPEEDEVEEPAKHLHAWSRDVTNDELVCLGCNKKAGSDA